MKMITFKKDDFIDYIPKNNDDYKKFIRLILKNTDSVCFTIKPFLDNIEEFNNSIWSMLSDNIIDYGFETAASDPQNEKSYLILLKNDYYLYDFLQGKTNLFDFTEEDPHSGLTMEDPAFIKDDEIFCYTITHEKICIVTEEIYRQLCAKS